MIQMIVTVAAAASLCKAIRLVLDTLTETNYGKKHD